MDVFVSQSAVVIHFGVDAINSDRSTATKRSSFFSLFPTFTISNFDSLQFRQNNLKAALMPTNWTVLKDFRALLSLRMGRAGWGRAGRCMKWACHCGGRVSKFYYLISIYNKLLDSEAYVRNSNGQIVPAYLSFSRTLSACENDSSFLHLLQHTKWNLLLLPARCKIGPTHLSLFLKNASSFIETIFYRRFFVPRSSSPDPCPRLLRLAVILKIAASLTITLKTWPPTHPWCFYSLLQLFM